MGSIKHLAPWAALAVLSLASAWLLEWAALPAALLLGPMIAAIIFGASGLRLKLPAWMFPATQAVIGCLVARTITVAILISVADDWATMLLVVSMTVLAGGLVGWALFKLGALPGTTAAWGSSPGAASAMIVMAQEYGADVQLVAFMQYLRVIVVVMTASLVSRLLLGAGQAAAPPDATPWLESLSATPLLPLLQTFAIAAAGSWIGQRLRIPVGGFLAPMVIGAFLHTTGAVEIALPPWLLAATYAALGWYVGLGFNRAVIRYAFRAIPQLLLATLLLIALCGFSAWVLTRLVHTDALTAYLATTPGGLDSVAIIAIGSHADTPFVLAVQTLRLFVVILTGPQIAKLICRYA